MSKVRVQGIFVVITLTTDFGRKDATAASMKGVMMGICPSARITDITHEADPRNAAALRKKRETR